MATAGIAGRRSRRRSPDGKGDRRPEDGRSGGPNLKGGVPVIDRICGKFDEFCEKYGVQSAESVLERICDAHCNGGEGDGCQITDSHQHNAINHTLSGWIEHEGERFYFIIDNGDRNGTVVREWGGPDDVGVYEPPKPTLFTFVPARDTDRARKIWNLWKESEWFKKKVGAYNYDRHFAPGQSTERYYREWAASKGMVIATEDEAKRFEEPSE